jgi:dTDP-4-amino-4,6-dideoxygalactose transaminase
MDAPHRRYATSGRAAISLALRLIGAKPGSAVLLPTYHCTTMVAPVVHLGLQPRFFPVTAQGAPDLVWLRQADLTGVVAILAAHYFGLPQPMASLREFCDARGIALIEDCAHAFFGLSDGRPVGSWGDVAIASLTKFFPVPEGGLIASRTRPLDTLTFDSPSLRNEIKAAADAIELGARYRRFPGLDPLLNGVFYLKRLLRRQHSHLDDAPGPNGIDLGNLMSGLLQSTTRPAHAVTRIVETVNQERIVSIRRRNYLELARQLSGVTGSRILRPELPAGAAPYVFPLYVDDHLGTYQRLRASGVPIFCWDQLWPGTPAIENDCGLDWAMHVFQLGCHQDLSSRDIADMARIVRNVIETSRPSP